VPGTRQTDRKFCEFAELAVDGDRAAMLLGNNVVADREAEPGALAGWLGRKERLEQFVPDLGRDAGAVGAHADLNLRAEVACRHLEARLEFRTIRLVAPSVGGVKAIAEQVEHHPCHILPQWARYYDRDRAPE